jgi:hypothetical protein
MTATVRARLNLGLDMRVLAAQSELNALRAHVAQLKAKRRHLRAEMLASDDFSRANDSLFLTQRIAETLGRVIWLETELGAALAAKREVAA